ncbi:MAG TPA: ABC transporter substrate-binding protein [Thermoanaerobaculia bacterium]|nr:ABC transporter substrate-binding protein [Thermoanaerobaculia bacterium]
MRDTSNLAGRYEIVSELGRGGMGVVYRARDPLLNREVAVKLISSTDLTAEIAERFQREAQLVAQMDHPGIVPIYDLGEHDGSLFFVMPVVEGENLRHMLWAGSLRLGEVLDIGIQVADALEYSHARGVVHRDIKPENIMVSRQDGNIRIRVMDFGLAHATTESRLTKTGTLVGTVAYLSPEQVTAHAFDGRSDIYSLGTVLYECLAGEPPFSGEVQSILYRIVHEVPQPPRALGAEIREELQDIILQCLQKDPGKRPQRAGHVSEGLRRHRASLQTEEFSRSVVLTASRMIQRPAASAFIGREKEFTELQHRLNAAIAGDCQFAVVAGEPGIGKTRLLEELKKLATVRKIRVLYGRFVEQGAFSYQGFCELIQDYFRTRDSGGSASDRPDFSDLAPELLSLFPLLTEISELRSAASGGSKLAAAPVERKAEDRIQIFELLARTLTRIGGGKPLVLILENLHGAEISIEALQYVVRRLGPTPTLVVGSYRQTETDKRHPLIRMLDSFADDPRFVSMTLGPFSPSEHRALIESVAGGAKVSDSLAERLRDATEGNPFFTKELVRSLIDSGGIAKDDSGAWNFSKATAISSDSLPATIQQAVEKRIERLPEDLRELLSIASVLGKSFDFRDLEALAEDAKNLDDATERLLREGMLEEERESRGDRLSFASGIVRDVLYNALSRRKRRSLHRKYAELLEKRYAGRLERVYPDLVHHFSQADVAEKSVEYGLKLAGKSLDAFSADEAIRAAKTCLEFLEDEEWTGDRSLEGEARLLVARAHRMAGNGEGALREAEAAMKVFEKEKLAEKSVGAVLFAAETAWQDRRVEETRRWVERGIEASASGGAPGDRGKLLSLAATVANLRGEYTKAAAYLAEIERLAPAEKEAEREIRSGGRLVAAMANPILTTDPGAYQTTEEHEVLGNVFETLVTTDSKGNLVPLLCERWSFEDGGRTVRLELRRGIVFSDGTPLTAAAVKASLERSIRASREATPAAFVAIEGVSEYLEGRAPGVSGIRTPSGDRVEIRLTDALPIFPAFLTDGRTSIALAEEGGAARLAGTGPFRIAEQSPERVVLERNPRYWKDTPARLDAVEFRASLSASAIASGLRSGELELARDLLPKDLEAILREQKFRSGLVETPKKNTYFALFNAGSAAGGNAALRQALAHAVRTQDFVWGALGRFALPATGLLPPGILGHDAGRRQAHPEREKAVEAIRSCGLPLPIKLSASVHPILLDQYAALTQALFRIWSDVGVEVTVATKTMGEYLESWHGGPGIDVWIGRWIADYDDPDNFTFTLFHSGNGRLRNYFSSPEADRLLEQARTESQPGSREALYRQFENLVLDSAALVPLFHDVDYRIASPRVRGLQLRSTAPYVNYAEIGKTEIGTEAGPERATGGGVLQIPIAGVVRSLEPSLASTVEQTEVMPSIFETLTQATQDARIIPWLASEIAPEAEGTRFRFRLRPGVRFHDGRRLTARDVRHSYERLLANRESEARWFLSPVRGAKRILAGEASDLEGFRIVSPSEFVIELEKPMSFFPALISYAATAIVPEGTRQVGRSIAEGAVGTGPFRVISFEPGRRLELERNPHYWREGYPRSEGLVFRFGVSPEEIRDEFLAGRLSLASDLLPADAEAFRHDARFASGYRETPRLQTYFIAFNRRRGPLKDVALRRTLAQSMDVPGAVRRTLGRLAIPAHGIIPPGLLGHSPASLTRPPVRGAVASSNSDVLQTVSRESVELLAAIHPVFFSEYAAFFEEIARAFREIGYTLRSAGSTMAEYMEARQNETADLIIGRWGADYPDADTFVHGILHSQEGFLGRYWGDTGADPLIERGRSETDPRVRHAIYREVEELVVREALLLPLFHDQVGCFVRPEVEGLTLGLTNPVVAYENLSVRR